MKATTKPFGKMRDIPQSIVRFSILPLLLVSEFVYFLTFFIISDQCTGSSSGYLSKMLICQDVWWVIFRVDFIWVSGLILIIWVAIHKTKYPVWFRVMALLYLLIVRFVAIWLSSIIQVKPFIT
jgi:hypothetical protein